MVTTLLLLQEVQELTRFISCYNQNQYGIAQPTKNQYSIAQPKIDHYTTPCKHEVRSRVMKTRKEAKNLDLPMLGGCPKIGDFQQHHPESTQNYHLQSTHLLKGKLGQYWLSLHNKYGEKCMTPGQICCICEYIQHPRKVEENAASYGVRRGTGTCN